MLDDVLVRTHLVLRAARARGKDAPFADRSLPFPQGSVNYLISNPAEGWTILILGSLAAFGYNISVCGPT